jgi:hypothetical protein
MARRFNTAGPCLPAYHYMVPPLPRLAEAPALVAQLGYFVVHAPPPDRETTALRALAEELTATGSTRRCTSPPRSARLLGCGRIDLLIRWPYAGPGGKRRWQREAIELKVWRKREPDPLAKGLAQLDSYLARLSLDHGVLVIFDRRPKAAPITERTAFAEATSPSGRSITVLRA